MPKRKKNPPEEGKSFAEAFEAALATLNYREREVVKLLYGIGDGYRYTHEEVARIFKVTPEKVAEVEAKAIRHLQHPERAGLMLDALKLAKQYETDKEQGPNVEVRDVLSQVEQLTPELMQHLRRREDDLVKLPWQVVEELVAECLASRGFEEVRLVGRNSETGADVFAIESTQSKECRLRYFIEVKRTKSRVGVEVIDRVYGAMQLEKPDWGWDLAMLVSLAGFKRPRKYTSEQLRYMGIILRDKDDVVKWLKDYRPSDKGLWLPANFRLEQRSLSRPAASASPPPCRTPSR